VRWVVELEGRRRASRAAGAKRLPPRTAAARVRPGGHRIGWAVVVTGGRSAFTRRAERSRPHRRKMRNGTNATEAKMRGDGLNE